MSNEHKGHRDRTRQLFLQMGGESLPDHILLEILLYYAVPRRDTNELAHLLLGAFGGIKGVLEADVDELQQVPGIGYNAAVLLKLGLSLFRSYLQDMQSAENVLDCTQKIGDYLVPMFIGKTDESLYLLCFNDRYKLLRCELIAQGIHNAVSINQKKIVERAALSKCSRVVIAHNHPGGVALPSDEDVRSTLQIHSTLKALHIQLVDHIIVSGDDYISLADSNIFVAL